MTQPVSISRFLGLRNDSDTLRMVTEDAIGLVQCDNLYIDDEFKPVFAEGFALSSAQQGQELFVSKDERRAYQIDGANLYAINSDITYNLLASDLSPGDTYDHCEVNEKIYLSVVDGTPRVVSTDGSVRRWGLPVPAQLSLSQTSGALAAGRYQATCTFVAPDGRESGAPLSTVIDLSGSSALVIQGIPQFSGTKTRVYLSSTDGDVMYRAFETTLATVVWNGPVDTLVEPLRTQFLEPPPPAERVTYYAGQMYVSKWDAHQNITAIYASQPFGYELFDTYRDVFYVPGRVYVLRATQQAIVIGTDSEIYLYQGDNLVKAADYGVPAGKSDVAHENTVYFWSNRGVCRAAPFENLTENTVSLPPGKNAYGAMMESGGVRKYVVMLDASGTARNAY